MTSFKPLFMWVLLILLNCGFYILGGNALKCYVCNSVYDQDCAPNIRFVPPPLKYLVECSHLTALPKPPPPISHDGVSRISIKQKNSPRSLAIPADENHYHGVNRSVNTNNSMMDEAIVGENLNYTSCRKQYVTIPEQDNGHGHYKTETTRIFRSCGWIEVGVEKAEKDICKVVSHEGIYNEQCTCRKDACNKGGAIVMNFSFLATIILVIIYFNGWIPSFGTRS